MTKVEREKYLLALNGGQRLALLITISGFLMKTDQICLDEFEETMLAYRPNEKESRGR